MKNRKWTGGQKNKEGTHHRTKYQDRSRFADWVHRLGFEQTSFGRWMNFLEEKIRFRQVAMLFLFCFFLGYLVHLDFEIPTNFQEGNVARVTIKSPLSFEMVDELATAEKRQAAEKSISPVFDYDSDLFDRLSAKIFDAFQDLRALSAGEKLTDRKSRQAERERLMPHKAEFEQLIGDSVPDRLFQYLIENQFSSSIETVLIRALERWMENKVVDGSVTDVGSVVLREISIRGTSKEMSVDANSFLDLSRRSNFRIKGIPGTESFRERDIINVTRLAYLLMKPNVTPNRQETAQRRSKAQQSVLPVVVAVKKNQVIISEGAVVQPVHLALLARLRVLQDNLRQDFRSFLTALLLMVLILVSFSYLNRFSLKKVHANSKDILFMALISVISVIMTKSFLFMTNAAFMEKLSDFIHPSTFLFAAPIAAGPMLVGLVVASGEIVWLFTVFLAAVLGLMVEQNFALFVVSLISGMAAVRGVHGCKKRNDIYWAGVRTGAIASFVIFLFVTIEHFSQPDYFFILLWTVPAGFVMGILSSMVTMILIPILESTFNYTTDIRLLELSNLNHPLLSEMLVRAPGTYHHSMMVGSLVESAAEQIGANPLLAKVMAYYHDIGKMEHAEYFIENQRKGTNPHDHISPYMSKTILIAHVKDGAELGMKYNLGKPIIDGILQHHGTGLISYFYNKAMQQADGNSGQPSEDEFRYPGPKPQFREAALVMLADGIEASARALDDPTPIRLQNIVRNIIQRRFMEAQLDECNLTLRDLSRCEAAFQRILMGIYHQRIDYPKSMGGGAADNPDNLRVLN